MTKPITWFGTWIPLIKAAQALCLSVTILMFLNGREQWFVYNIAFIFAFLALFFALFTIFVRYFEINGPNQLSFNTMELSLNALFSLISFCLASALLWDIWNMRRGPHHFKYHTRLAPHNIGQNAWVRRCVIVASTFLLTALLFLITFLKLHRSRH